MRHKHTNCIALFLLFMAISMFAVAGLSGCQTSARHTYHAYSGSVSVSLGLGKEGMLVEESPFPVTVHVDGDYAEEGSWCVLTVPTNANDYYAYRKPLTTKSSQTISFIVPAAKYSSQVTLEILDSDEHVIYSRTSTYQAYDEWQNMILAGQLGTQTDSVSWPDEITRADFGTTITVRNVTLTQDNLYSQKEGYNMLDFLTVDVSYFEGLDEDVQKAMLAWVKSGGTLVFQGSGGWSMFQRMGVSGFGDSKNFSVGGNVKLLYRTLGSGKVWFLSGTLSQTAARLTDDRKTTLLKALSDGTSGSYSEDYSSLTVYDKSPLIDRIKAHKSSAETPKVWQYIAILVLYLAVGIPGIYFFVRRKKIIRWFRPLVCLLAVVFSILIFIAGTNTRYSRPFLQSLTVLSDENCEENTLTETVYTGIQAPFNSNYEVSLSHQYNVNAIMDAYYWGSGTQNGAVNAKRVATVSFHNDQTLLSMENLTAFSSRYFELQKNITGIGTITGTVTNNDFGLLGTLVNNTKYELVSAVVNVGDELALIEHWQPGETIDLEAEQKNGRVHMMTRDQFSDGAYRNRGQWIGQLSDYYEYFLYTKNNNAAVMAQIDYTPALQEYTDYPVENNTILRLSVSSN